VAALRKCPDQWEAFEALKSAAEVLTDDDAREALDARLLELPLNALALQELRWSRELAGLAEAEEDGEVRGGGGATLETRMALASNQSHPLRARAVHTGSRDDPALLLCIYPLATVKSFTLSSKP
jgi:hypothetical protein